MDVLRSEEDEYQSWGSFRLKDIREFEEKRCASFKMSKDEALKIRATEVKKYKKGGSSRLEKKM